MHKVVFFARRDEDVGREELYDFFEDEHAPIVADLPGLVKYSYGRAHDPGADHDMTASLYWESREDLEAAMDSDLMDEVLDHGRPYFDKTAEVSLVVDETVLFEK